jgi:hypothetical protein
VYRWAVAPLFSDSSPSVLGHLRKTKEPGISFPMVLCRTAHHMGVAAQKSNRFQQQLPGLVSNAGSGVLVQNVEVLFSVHEVTYEGHRKLI